jgi:hypothetical protein
MAIELLRNYRLTKRYREQAHPYKKAAEFK